MEPRTGAQRAFVGKRFTKTVTVLWSLSVNFELQKSLAEINSVYIVMFVYCMSNSCS
jgi:hypothetical protein